MIDSVFSILGLEYATLQISDTALVAILALVFLYIIDWTFRLISMLVGAFVKRR